MSTFHLERHDEIQANQVFELVKNDRKKFFAQYRIYVRSPRLESVIGRNCSKGNSASSRCK